MLDFRRILCPVDFSNASRHAVDHAVTLGEWYDAQITVLHVVPTMVLTPPILFAERPSTTVSRETNRRELGDQVREWLSPALKSGLHPDVVIDEGNPAERILAHAVLLQANLIVMGTHGRGGFERLIMGSVAEKVLRKATCPVMTVPPPAVATSRLPFTHLLCPVDFSPSSQAALQIALSIAQEANARLTLLHVFEWPSDEASARRVLEMSDYHRQWEAETRQQLAALIPDDVRNWCTPESKLGFGKAYQQILGLAATDQVDLIVMGVRGRSPLDMTFFGSTTNHVVRSASCPVLTLRG